MATEKTDSRRTAAPPSSFAQELDDESDTTAENFYNKTRNVKRCWMSSKLYRCYRR